MDWGGLDEHAPYPNLLVALDVLTRVCDPTTRHDDNEEAQRVAVGPGSQSVISMGEGSGIAGWNAEREFGRPTSARSQVFMQVEIPEELNQEIRGLPRYDQESEAEKRSGLGTSAL